MSKKFDALVYIGRFQPVHNGHASIIQQALSMAEHVIVVIGSAWEPRTYHKNPFTLAERMEMILQATPEDCRYQRVHLAGVSDFPYNNQAWAAAVQMSVHMRLHVGDRVGIIGHKKDASSFYLDMFPQWTYVPVEPVLHNGDTLSATQIRDAFFQPHPEFSRIENMVPPGTMPYLMRLWGTPMHKQMVVERQFIEGYKRQFASLPYPPIFVTTDAVVIQSGHVLLIKRKSEPGKGLWALPGGFINANTDRSVEDAMLRELEEETGIKVPSPVLRGNIQGRHVFDAIDRSARGRTITHAFKIVLPDGKLPRVKGQDDAEKAKWIPFADLRAEKFFEDHYHIIKHFVGS